MFKTPTEYAKLLLEMFSGNKDNALAELFEAAKAHPRVPNIFWRDVFLAVERNWPEYYRRQIGKQT